MKVKEIRVVVRPMEEDLEEVVDALKRVERGEEFEDEKIVVESLDVLRKILTPERLRILQVIRNERPGSIYELAKMLDRDRAAVVRDLEYLQQLGLVEFEEERKGKRRSRKPVVPYDEIEVSIPVVG
jgi:predicted transcriptional regulator